ncbi:MAG: RNA polymerase sporulation sigma factor SigH [Clostridia bacterium]|nr:RNA polymerase sporulation sigma factor SigH [Clostridia bacterium]
MEKNMFSINENEYTQMTDEKLIENIKADDNKALNCLIERYHELVNIKANKFFMIGSEKEDMVQEGLIGLYKAVKSFDAEKENSFKTFANMCIERQLITAVKNSNRQKHIPLNSSVSLNAAAYEDNEDTDKFEVINIKVLDDPSEIIVEREYFKSMEKQIKDTLSAFELQVLSEYEKGKSYAAIAEKLQAKVKSVDTAIQRIRKKANKIKESIE